MNLVFDFDPISLPRARMTVLNSGRDESPQFTPSASVESLSVKRRAKAKRFRPKGRGN